MASRRKSLPALDTGTTSASVVGAKAANGSAPAARRSTGSVTGPNAVAENGKFTVMTRGDKNSGPAGNTKPPLRRSNSNKADKTESSRADPLRSSAPNNRALTPTARPADGLRASGSSGKLNAHSNGTAGPKAPATPAGNGKGQLTRQLTPPGTSLQRTLTPPSPMQKRGSPGTPPAAAGASKSAGHIKDMTETLIHNPRMRSVTGPPPGVLSQSAGAELGQRMGRNNTSAGVGAALSHTQPPPGSSAGGRPRAPPVGTDTDVVIHEMAASYGSASLQGMRNYQEDMVGFFSSAAVVGGGVYDGHGGNEVSKELEKCLLPALAKALGEGNPKDGSGLGAGPAAITGAIQAAFLNTNEEVTRRVPAAQDAGSCAAVVVMTRAAGVLHLFAANVGDCRVVMYTGPSGQKKAVRLSEDHKPLPQVCPAEITRVTNAGGCVLWGRVQGCLAVSRAFGDRSLHPFVIADPAITVRPLNLAQDEFVYISSDGVTDVIDDAAGCQMISDALARGASCSGAAHALCNAAFQKGSSDNISAVVIRLNKKR